MKIKFVLPGLLALFFAGCKNDLVINAPYKDIAVVYGFLDQNEPVQYIRIEKLYQNSATSNTTEGAQISDSLYFSNLVVDLINLSTQDTFHCYRVDSIPKNSGLFSTAKNTLYATSIPKNNSSNHVYRLNIYYPKGDKTFSSQTAIVKDAIIDFRNIVMKVTPANHTFPFKFKSGANAALYDVVIRYQYKEMNISDTTQFEIKNVDYYVAKNYRVSPLTDYYMTTVSKVYLDYLATQIKPDNSKIRSTVAIYYHAYGGSADFAHLLDLSKPNLSVVQKNAEFSNISNGLGLFTSRNFVELKMGIDPGTVGVIHSGLPNFK